jgi:hypothetical protein
MHRTGFIVALILVKLEISSLAQTTSVQARSAAQAMVLGYFHDVLDDGKSELIDNMFLHNCAIHRPEGESKGLDPLRAMSQCQGRSKSFDLERGYRGDCHCLTRSAHPACHHAEQSSRGIFRPST